VWVWVGVWVGGCVGSGHGACTCFVSPCKFHELNTRADATMLLVRLLLLLEQGGSVGRHLVCQ
jgi:hypothetical protein